MDCIASLIDLFPAFCSCDCLLLVVDGSHVGPPGLAVFCSMSCVRAPLLLVPLLFRLRLDTLLFQFLFPNPLRTCSLSSEVFPVLLRLLLTVCPSHLEKNLPLSVAFQLLLHGHTTCAWVSWKRRLRLITLTCPLFPLAASPRR